MATINTGGDVFAEYSDKVAFDQRKNWLRKEFGSVRSPTERPPRENEGQGAQMQEHPLLGQRYAGYADLPVAQDPKNVDDARLEFALKLAAKHAKMYNAEKQKSSTPRPMGPSR